MQTILIFGAGKSATVLIDYLGKCCEENNWTLIVCDSNLELVKSKIKKYSSARAISIDVTNDDARHSLISEASLVISMLPPTLHFFVAKDCVDYSKCLLTASYLDASIKSLENEIREKGLLFLSEMGLDPGIDHMSAMKIINSIEMKGGKVTSFKSHCGGLIAPESDDNPWHYKITWNPRNVVMAGSAGAVFLENNHTVKIAYSDIFKDENNTVEIPGLFPLAWYANRDSMSYIDTYNLHGVSDFIRTTLRYPSFCKGWNKIVTLDLTNADDHEIIKGSKTFESWFNLKKNILLEENKGTLDEDSFFKTEFLEQIAFLDMRSEELIPPEKHNSADILQFLMEKKLVMKPDDKDMIVMLHEIEYIINGHTRKIRSCLLVKGDNDLYTSMAKTVGLPLGIAAKLILQNKINITGIHIPVIPEIYEPVLKELAEHGIQFTDEECSL